MHIPGKQLIIADTLSRGCISNNTQEIKDDEMENYTIQKSKKQTNKQNKQTNIQWVTINSTYIEAKWLKTQRYKC